MGWLDNWASQNKHAYTRHSEHRAWDFGLKVPLTLFRGWANDLWTSIWGQQNCDSQQYYDVGLSPFLALREHNSSLLQPHSFYIFISNKGQRVYFITMSQVWECGVHEHPSQVQLGFFCQFSFHPGVSEGSLGVVAFLETPGFRLVSTSHEIQSKLDLAPTLGSVFLLAVFIQLTLETENMGPTLLPVSSLVPYPCRIKRVSFMHQMASIGVLVWCSCEYYVLFHFFCIHIWLASSFQYQSLSKDVILNQCRVGGNCFAYETIHPTHSWDGFMAQ